MNESMLAAAYPFWGKLSGEERERILAGCTLAAYGKGEHIHRSDMGLYCFRRGPGSYAVPDS